MRESFVCCCNTFWFLRVISDLDPNVQSNHSVTVQVYKGCLICTQFSHHTSLQWCLKFPNVRFLPSKKADCFWEVPNWSGCQTLTMPSRLQGKLPGCRTRLFSWAQSSIHKPFVCAICSWFENTECLTQMRNNRNNRNTDWRRRRRFLFTFPTCTEFAARLQLRNVSLLLL